MAHRTHHTPDEHELETLAEAELARLKRQYRIMENDRVACAEDARLQLQNQMNILNHLEYEKAELVLRIKSSNSKTFARQDQEMEEKLKCLLKVYSSYDDMVKSEREEITELDKHILKLTNEVTSLKMKVRTDAQLRDIAEKQQKTVRMLENRLDVAVKRFNIIIAKNAAVRNEIEALLKERAQFTTLWKKLIGQLNTGKQIINDLIEQSTIAFNQRDDVLNTIQALRERGMRDLKTHVSEMCELQRTLDNEMKLQDFLGVKGQHREMVDLNEKRAAEQKTRMEEKQNMIASYKQVLHMIKEFTGEQEIDKLTAHFIKQEEENFALFSYVNELNDELESLQTRMIQLTAAIQEANHQKEHQSKEQAETLEKLKRELEEQTALADAAEERVTQCDDILEKLLKGIDSLFKAIRCDNSPILELLGDNEQITRSNVMLYLGIVEKRITQMFHKVYWVDRATKSQQLRLDEDKRPRLKIPPIKYIAPTQPCALCVEKEELQIVSEGLEQPLTRNEATTKLKQRLEEDYSDLLHNISGCHLPAARKIIQRRYQ
ncbi:PREDICTED: coiled-coil domain-containing protein 63 [Dufourea novaeangliae]|uniref:Coiled-coil domain-containing protein 63 n=1 Tax=Dufourea novaeangliae TaxID=178035 RepID=A0A154PL56_DUFNO|nr:PREDICTED: coiled-coil domain-containing protein 63 [Dufourea novaeangliae]KZC12586.1 Coiled-coil domain-containing protein 63 [Dufourea novaeangliae]